MSVRPVSVGEEIKAFGHPWVNILSLFGATQGLLVYLHRNRIPVTSNWFAAPGRPSLFVFLVVGGYITGGTIAMAAFSDWSLIRLVESHRQDNALLTDSQTTKTLGY